VELTPVELTPVELTPVELTPVELTPVEPAPVRAGDAGRRDPQSWDARILEVYRGLMAARNVSHALQHGD